LSRAAIVIGLPDWSTDLAEKLARLLFPSRASAPIAASRSFTPHRVAWIASCNAVGLGFSSKASPWLRLLHEARADCWETDEVAVVAAKLAGEARAEHHSEPGAGDRAAQGSNPRPRRAGHADLREALGRGLLSANAALKMCGKLNVGVHLAANRELIARQHGADAIKLRAKLWELARERLGASGSSRISVRALISVADL